MRRFSLVVFIGIKAAFVASLESCVYEPPKCYPSTTVQLEDGTSVDLVQKWVPFPRTNKYTANFCKGTAPNGFYTCRRPDCTSTPCLHGSTCVETRSSFKCYCAEGYYGSNCQNALTVSPSSMGSTTTPTFSSLNASTSTVSEWTSVTAETTAATTHDVTIDSSTHDVTTTATTHDVTTVATTHDVTTAATTQDVTTAATTHDVTTPASTQDVTTEPSTSSTTSQASTTGESSSSSDPASASYQGKEYGYPTPVTEQTFDNARQTCTGFGPASSSNSGLLELTDELEKAYIIDYVSRSSIPAGSSLWIGCPKYLSGDPEHGFYCYNSNYRYSSNHNIDIGYWDWDSGEPQKQGRRCMVLNLATQKYRAEYCDVAAAVALCEWSPPSQ